MTALEWNDWFRALRQEARSALDAREWHDVLVELTARLPKDSEPLRPEDTDLTARICAAACESLTVADPAFAVIPEEKHWKAAIGSCEHADASWSEVSRDASQFGLDFGSPEAQWRLQFEEALCVAGYRGRAPSFVRPEDQRIALGLVVNWGLRLLVARFAKNT